MLNKHRFALLIALATVSLPLAAQAQRKSPLADAPAIRKIVRDAQAQDARVSSVVLGIVDSVPFRMRSMP